MNDLSLNDRLLFFANAVVCVGMIAWRFLKRNPLQFWAPPMFVGAIFLYYSVVGPTVTFVTNSGIDRGIDMFGYYGRAWLGGLVTMLSWLAGYSVLSSREIPHGRPGVIATVALRDLWRLAVGLNVIGVSCYIVVAGPDVLRQLRPFAALDGPSTVGYTGGFYNYFALAINFLIPGCALLLLIRLRGWGGWLGFLASVVFACLIYLAMGFRYRLLLLFGSLAFVYYLQRRQRPSVLIAVVSFAAIVFIMGEIGATRQYGLGLDLSRRSSSLTESMLNSFGEATIFGTSGAVLTHVPGERGFVGFEPIVQALLMPIPAAFYANKSSDAYLVGTLVAIYGRDAYGGAAYMSFAEWYLAFGWPGLIGFHFLLGLTCRWLWRWYLPRQHNPLALVIYASSISYLYVVFSRGYFPQVVTLFFFSVVPAIIVYLWPQKCVFWAPVRRLKASDLPGRAGQAHAAPGASGDQ